ncbi:MAG: LuxR C-terminal-related transcriptional regulator [Bacteroidota bacterium]
MFKKRITIIDRDEDFCLAVGALLKNSDGFQLNKIYQDPREALKRIKEDFSEIIIMDLDFTEVKGTDFILKAREKVPSLEILIISDYDEEQIVFQALGHGASGYLLKRKCFPHLLQALNTLSIGGAALDPLIARQIIQSIQINKISPLSPRESMVLKLLVQGKTYSSIAQDLFISGETVKTHLKHIYKKLNVNTKAQAIKRAVTDQLVTAHMRFNY